MTEDKVMPEFNLKQQRFIYSACGPFTKHCERIQKFRETGDLQHLFKNELDIACLAHDAPYSDSKELAKTTISDKILKIRAYEIARNPGYYGHERALAIIVYKFFDKKTGSGISVNEQLAEVLPKAVTKKFTRRKVYPIFKDNMWAADLADMRSLSSKNKNVKYFLCVLDVFTKYAWVKPLKDKKRRTVVNLILLIWINKYNNTIILIIILLVKNLLMPIIPLWLKTLRKILKLLNLKWMIKLELLSIKVF